MVLASDVRPLSGLYPCLSSSEIVVVVHRNGDTTTLQRTLADNASADGYAVFEDEKQLWESLSSWGLSPPLRLVGNTLIQPFNQVQLSAVSRYHLKKNSRHIALSSTKLLALLEDHGVLIRYFSPSSFSVPHITGSGAVSLIDVSTATFDNSDVYCSLLSLAYYLLELITGKDRSDLPSELSYKKLAEYRPMFPPEVYQYIRKLSRRESFSSMRGAYDALRRVSWAYAVPPLKRLRKYMPGKRVVIASCAVIAFSSGAILPNYLEAPERVPVAPIIPGAVEIDDTFALRYRIFIKRECVGCDLSGWKFLEENLAGVNLSEANLTNARIDSSDVANINLSGAILDGATLENLTFSDANLLGVSLEDASFYKVVFRNVNLSHTNFSVIGNYSSLSFSGVNFNYAVLDGVSLSHSDDSTASSGAGRPGVTSFRYASMRGFSYSGDRLAGIDFTGADFTNAQLEEISFANAVLDGAKFTGANLYRANLRAVFARGANFDTAKLDRASVHGATFDGSSMRGASLRRLKGEDEASIAGVDMSGADTFRTRFD